ncbi:hypothetical protein AZ78_4947 [Lysobacter capsici AZ78]|uniref:Uncharacterized protein n=1 Tax=Lysobacter capsici AZ78 TaxID=1444315 RepID=A0A108U4A0_9GAMM|nr:hypothetical protein AZ78_4947 [Lysobacter capsici AZ78]
MRRVGQTGDSTRGRVSPGATGRRCRPRKALAVSSAACRWPVEGR